MTTDTRFARSGLRLASISFLPLLAITSVAVGLQTVGGGESRLLLPYDPRLWPMLALAAAALASVGLLRTAFGRSKGVPLTVAAVSLPWAVSLGACSLLEARAIETLAFASAPLRVPLWLEATAQALTAATFGGRASAILAALAALSLALLSHRRLAGTLDGAGTWILALSGFALAAGVSAQLATQRASEALAFARVDAPYAAMLADEARAAAAPFALALPVLLAGSVAAVVIGLFLSRRTSSRRSAPALVALGLLAAAGLAAQHRMAGRAEARVQAAAEGRLDLGDAEIAE